MKSKFSYTFIYFSALLIISLLSCSGLTKRQGPSIKIVKSIADRVINESIFDFNLVPQPEVLDIQIVNFRETFGKNTAGVGYALSYIQTEHDTTVNIGVSYSERIKIWLNDQLVFQHTDNPEAFRFNEIAYGLFVFQDTFSVDLQAGDNKLLIKTDSGNDDQWRFLLRPLTSQDRKVKNIKFSIEPYAPEIMSSKWLCIGPFPGAQQKSTMENPYPPEKELKDYYDYENELVTWSMPKTNILLELKIDPGHTYTRDSYLEWHYANGATMMGIIALADQTSEKKYLNFVCDFCDFTVEHVAYFRWQYETLLALRGTNHRLFRLTMLDDASGPALPLLEMYLHKSNEQYLKIINRVADYVRNEQDRLDDGSLCRPEPAPQTLWADDLFMSVPFLLRMAKISGDESYNDDAADQVIRFAEKLFDAETQLFYHSWNEITKQHSVAKWGRANGWMMWAMSEALLHLPKTHKHYGKIRKIFQNHVAGLVSYQDESGMWHQVLDHPQSFEETSCTAMFTLGIARGVRNGWIDKKYRTNALRAWDALQTKIENGIVSDICKGTGVGDDLDFYFNRPRFPNDPRGLGAVMIAGIEIDKL